MRLGDFVGLQRGTTYKSALLGQDGPVLLGLASIQADGGFRRSSLRTYGGESPAKLLLRPGDIYVSLKDVTQSGDLLGSVARVPADIRLGRLTQDTVKLNFNEDEVPADYLYWMLRTPSYRAYCRARAIGTTNLSLSREDFLNFEVRDPSPDGLLVVATLRALDDKVESNRRILCVLESIARAFFRAWFVDLEPLRLDTDEKDVTALPHGFVQAFPMGLAGSPPRNESTRWASMGLKDVCSYIGRGISPAYTDLGGVLVINQKCVRGHRIDLRPARRHDVLKKSIAGREAREGDVLVNSTGAGTLGRVAQLHRLDETAIVDSHVTIVRADPRRITPTVLAQTCFWHEQEIEALGEGTTGQTELSRDRLGQLEVRVPPMQLQQRFDAIVAPMRSLMDSLDRECLTLGELRDALLPKLLSGEVRVREAESLVEVAV